MSSHAENVLLFQYGRKCKSSNERSFHEELLRVHRDVEDAQRNHAAAKELGRVLLEKNTKLTEEIQSLKIQYANDREVDVDELEECKRKCDYLQREKRRLEDQVTSQLAEIATLEARLNTESKLSDGECVTGKKTRELKDEELDCQKATRPKKIKLERTATSLHLVMNDTDSCEEMQEEKDSAAQTERKLAEALGEIHKLREVIADKNTRARSLTSANESLKKDLEKALFDLEQTRELEEARNSECYTTVEMVQEIFDDVEQQISLILKDFPDLQQRVVEVLKYLSPKFNTNYSLHPSPYLSSKDSMELYMPHHNGYDDIAQQLDPFLKNLYETSDSHFDDSEVPDITHPLNNSNPALQHYYTPTYDDTPADPLYQIPSQQSWLYGSQDLLHTSQWISDTFTDQCMLCLEYFTFFSRKHHCRVCGIIICASCSPYRALVPSVDRYRKVRICTNCYSARSITPVPPTQEELQRDATKLTFPLVNTDIYFPVTPNKLKQREVLMKRIIAHTQTWSEILRECSLDNLKKIMRHRNHEELVHISNICVDAVYVKVKQVLSVFLAVENDRSDSGEEINKLRSSSGSDNSSGDQNNNINNNNNGHLKVIVVLCKIFLENCKYQKAMNLKCIS